MRHTRFSQKLRSIEDMRKGLAASKLQSGDIQLDFSLKGAGLQEMTGLGEKYRS